MHLQLKLSVLVLFLCSFVAASAQTTSVTATITDSDSTVWTGASVFVSFQPNPAQPSLNSYTLGGVKLTSTTYSSYLQQAVTTNSSGTLSVTLLDNNLITPSGSKWYFVIQSQTSAQAVTYVPISVSGASQSLTSYLSSGAIAPRFPAVNQAFGYADVEVHPIPQPGGQYYNVTLGTQRIWNGTAWTNGSSGGSPSGAAGGALSGSYPNPTIIGTNIAPKIDNGVSKTCQYTGATMDIRLASATADAINKTNGNTTGLVDASCESGNQLFAATGVFGDSNNDSVGYIIPCAAYWTYTGSGGPGFIWNGGATIVSPCGGNGNQLNFTVSSTSNPTYVMEAIGGGTRPYISGHGFQISNVGAGGHPTTSGIGFFLTGQFADVSTLDAVNVYDDQDNIKEEVFGGCCQMSQIHSSINGGFTGTVNLFILTNTNINNTFTRDFTFSNGTIVHPGNGGFDVYCQDVTHSTVSGFALHDIYGETGDTSNPSALILIDGCTRADISGLDYPQYGSAGFPGIYVTGAYNTLLTVDNMWFSYGTGPWSTPATAIVNVNTNQNLKTDNNGYYGHYTTPSAPSSLNGAQQPGDIVTADANLAAARLSGNLAATDAALISHGATTSPLAYTCASYQPSGTVSTCTFSTPVPAGSIITIGAEVASGTTPTITASDSAGDYYSSIGTPHEGVYTPAGIYNQIFYFGPTASSVSTVTISTVSSALIEVGAQGASNVTPLLEGVCYGDSTATNSPVPCGTAITTSHINDYVMCYGIDTAGGLTVGSGFTAGSSANASTLSQYKVQATTGAFTPSINTFSNAVVTLACAAFQGGIANTPGWLNAPALSAANMSSWPALTPPSISTPVIVDTTIGTSPSTSPICPNGSGGAFTTSGCTSGSGAAIVTHTITGATPTVVVNSTSVPAVDVNNLVLSTNVTSITLPASTAVANSENIKLNIYQPASGGPYTLPTYTTATSPLTAGSGTTLVSLVQSGCPTIGTAANSQLQFELVYNTTLTQYQIVQCQLQPAVYSPGGTLTANGQAGIYSSGTVLNSDLMPLPGHFTNLEIVYGGGGCTTAPYLNVFASIPNGTPAYGTPGQGSTTTQTPGQGVDTTETLTFVAGQRIGIEVSTAALGCSASYYSITAHYVFSNNSN